MLFMTQVWRLITENWPVLLSGIWITVSLSVMAMGLSIVVGLVACLCVLSRHKVLRYPVQLYIELFRNTPILVVVVWIHYALPDLVGLKFTAYTSALVALTLQSSGYLAEEFRAGIESIDRGQFEAAQSLGMTYERLMRRIVIPQAAIRMLPGILNQYVNCFKSTSIVSIIAVPDLMYYASMIVTSTFLPMPVYTLVALIYFGLVYLIALGVRKATSRLPNFGYFAAERPGV
jgi:polar amino acid transport system permease protein